MSDTVVLMEAKYDNLFKSIITAGWNVTSDGHVESPQGFFAVVEIPANFAEFNDLVDAVDPDSEFESDDWPEPGWYFTVENSDGLIRVYKSTQRRASAAFQEALGSFAAWEAE